MRACLALLLALPSAALAADRLYVPDVTVTPGGTAEVSVLLDASAPVGGWSFGLCHDGTALALRSADPGPDALTCSDGGAPDYQSTDIVEGGVVQGVIVSFDDDATVGPGDDLILLELAYDVLGADGDTTALCPCDTLGAPEVPVEIWIDGVATEVDTTCGTVRVSDLVDDTDDGGPDEDDDPASIPECGCRTAPGSGGLLALGLLALAARRRR